MVKHNQKGFTLIELMVVVTIIGVLAAIAYPNYQNYVIRTKRADMMAEMQSMASKIESKKTMMGSYAKIPNAEITNVKNSFNQALAGLYTVEITPSPLTKNWVITATPVATSQMGRDGNLVLHADGRKCRATTCGMADEWKN